MRAACVLVALGAAVRGTRRIAAAARPPPPGRPPRRPAALRMATNSVRFTAWTPGRGGRRRSPHYQASAPPIAVCAAVAERRARRGGGASAYGSVTRRAGIWWLLACWEPAIPGAAHDPGPSNADASRRQGERSALTRRAGLRSPTGQLPGRDRVAASDGAAAGTAATDDRAHVSIEAPASPRAEEPRPIGRGLGSRGGWLLAVCCVAQFMVILDLSIVNVALPSIQLSLGFSSTELQWVVDAYTITFAGFLLLGGRAADRFGQRRMFVAALLLFGLASLAGGARPGSRSADRRSRGAGPGRRPDGGVLAGDHHLVVSARAEAPPRDRHLGGDERARRRGRGPARGDHHPGADLALDPADQSADRDRGRAGRLRGRARSPRARGTPRASTSPAR